jgi:hypothetical protein
VQTAERASIADNPRMGIALWFVASVAAFFLARMTPWLRSAWLGELSVAILAGLACGVLATALDFGGWSEPDWRAALFAFLGALAVLGAFRLIFGRALPSPASATRADRRRARS